MGLECIGLLALKIGVMPRPLLDDHGTRYRGCGNSTERGSYHTPQPKDRRRDQLTRMTMHQTDVLELMTAFPSLYFPLLLYGKHHPLVTSLSSLSQDI